MSTDKKKLALEQINIIVTRATETLVKFTTGIAENAAVAFQWGDDAVMAAATQREYGRARRSLELAEMTVDKLIAGLQRDLLSAASSPKRSTAPLSNLLAQYELAAIADLIELLNRCEL